MVSRALISLTDGEIEPLREAMLDVQDSVADYYASTAGPADLGVKVRAFLTNTQRLNDHFSSEISDTKSYRALFDHASEHDVEVINGIRYARNIVEHVLHIVRPKDDALIGGVLGFREYPVWDEVPEEVHTKLRPRTRDLKISYDTELKGQSVIETMLRALRFYSSIAPEIVHRDQRGEWTGFPLMSQPAVLSPLHPEEPLMLAEAWDWLNGRKPNGEARIVCCQMTTNDVTCLLGFTFSNSYSFSPFVETINQVREDIAAGFPYLTGNVAANTEDVTSRFPSPQLGSVLYSSADISNWTEPLDLDAPVADWCSHESIEQWQSVARTESYPKEMTYQIRRARRLNALTPPNR